MFQNNTHFYSCHFRVDIFKYLSKLKKTYSILIDLDVLILNRLDILKNLKSSDAFVNEINDNVVPAYGNKNILRNLNILNKNLKNLDGMEEIFLLEHLDFNEIHI